MSKIDEFRENFKDVISREIEKKGRYYFNIPEKDLRKVARHLFEEMGCRLSTATGSEMEDHLQIIYHFSHDESGQYFCPRVVIRDKENPEIDSIVPILMGAKWIERELFDFWGIKFKDHPDMRRLLALNHPENLDKPMRFKKEDV